MRFIDDAKSNLSDSNIRHYIRGIVSGLEQMRRESTPAYWRKLAPAMRTHPALQLAYKCPFTRHGAARPFGYPGDATLIDHIYGYVEPPAEPDARQLYAYTTTTAASRAVRFRRGVMANYIDDALNWHGNETAIFSVACGHLRELDLSIACRRIRPARFIALDQDEPSLAKVREQYAGLGVSTVPASVAEIIAGKRSYQNMDLVYSSGLYDYLNQKLSIRLTQKLFSMLAPGGKLVFVNFLPDIRDAGYMEAVMDWWLIHRGEEAMLDILNGLPGAEVASHHQFTDPDRNVSFMEVVRN